MRAPTGSWSNLAADPLPQLMVTVWASRAPGSAKEPSTVTVPPSPMAEDVAVKTRAPGGVLLTVTVATVEVEAPELSVAVMRMSNGLDAMPAGRSTRYWCGRAKLWRPG